MAETTTTIRSTLITRLGLDTTTTAELARLSEIVDSSVALVFGDYVPALSDILVGTVPGELSVTVSSHTAGSSSVTLSTSPSETRRGDIFTDSAGVDYLIRSVAGAVLDLGIPVPTAITGAATIYRRTLKLPDPGSVDVVYSGTSSTHRLSAGKWGGETTTGTARHYQQMWDGGESYILLFPAPTGTNTRFTVHQQRAVAKDAALDVPNGVIERILATAVVLYVAWTSGQYEPASRAKRDAKDLSGESAGGGVYIK